MNESNKSQVLSLLFLLAGNTSTTKFAIAFYVLSLIYAVVYFVQLHGERTR